MLVLQLKRFEYVDGARIRLDAPVAFPLEGLDLREQCVSPDCRTFPSDIAALRAGQRVQLEGLRGKDTQALNGLHGHIEHLDHASKKYLISLDGADLEEWVEVGADNLKLVCDEAASADCPPPMYDLAAVCTHMGTAAFGHYMAFVRSSEDGRWRACNDEQVWEVSAEEVTEEQAGAYLLFYFRRDMRPGSWASSADC